MPTHPVRTYEPALLDLLKQAPINVLGPGTPHQAVRAKLAKLTPDQIVAPHKLTDRDMGLACLAGLWLRFDFLDESHQLSQEIETPTGSFWHGIMHRREPDFANAKYWFRRVGMHPIFESLQSAARHFFDGEKPPKAANFLKDQPTWEPLRFVDLCEEAIDGEPPLDELCKRIQACEWDLLFEFSYLQAIE